MTNLGHCYVDQYQRERDPLRQAGCRLPEGPRADDLSPGGSKKDTPLGSYNSDWAVLVEQDGAQRLYFVVETKSSLFTDDLRDKESAKIACGKEHFQSLAVGENPAQYVVARSLDDVLAKTHGVAT